MKKPLVVQKGPYKPGWAKPGDGCDVFHYIIMSDDDDIIIGRSLCRNFYVELNKVTDNYLENVCMDCKKSLDSYRKLFHDLDTFTKTVQEDADAQLFERVAGSHGFLEFNYMKTPRLAVKIGKVVKGI